jgi:MOSC domain-containing protein
MHVAELWRYPVKSMAGERLERAEIRTDGIAGDRIALVTRGDRIITSRTHSRLLAHHAAIGSGGQPYVDGHPWSSPLVAQWVTEAAGEGARLVRYDGPERFDVLPLLVATDGAIAAFGEDGRRLRPNIVIGGVEGLAERSWEGKFLRIGNVTIGIRDLRQRCVMTTFHPDTLVQDVKVLRRIAREFDGSMALNCSVITPGTVGVGDRVEVNEG